MFATKRRHGRRPKANTREGKNPRFDGFAVSPLSPGTTGCRREQTQSAARTRHRQGLLPVTLSFERAHSVTRREGGFQSDLNKIKNSPLQSENAVNKSITIFGVESIFKPLDKENPPML